MDPDRSLLAASRAVLVGTSRYDDRRLPSVPQVRNSFNRMLSVLTNPQLGRWPTDSVAALPEAAGRSDVIGAIRQAGEAATRCLLVYYVGHGLPGVGQRVFLALQDTSMDRLDESGVDVDTLFAHVSSSGAALKIVVLDCCWSKRAELPADGWLPGPARGVMVIAASAEVAKAHPDPDALTALTDALLRPVIDGVADGPECLSLGLLWETARRTLEASGFPEPHQQSSDTAAQFPFARNVAHRPVRLESRRPVDGSFVDREDETTWLRSTVESSRAAVVVVTGIGGVGKSTLAQLALGHDPAAPDPTMAWHTMAPGTHWDVEWLIDDVKLAIGPVGRRGGGSPLDRLRAALEAVGRVPRLIVVDAAEHLLVPGGNQFPLELDEALDLLTATSDEHRVRLVLIMPDRPSSALGGRWPNRMEHREIGEIPEEHFRRYLGILDFRGTSGLGELEGAPLTRCWRVLGGNPRLAELLHAVLELGRSEDVEPAVERYSTIGPGRLQEELRLDVMQLLPLDCLRTLRAVAALRTAAAVPMVEAALGPDGPGIAVGAALRRLAGYRLIGRTDDGRFFVPGPDTGWILDAQPADERAALLLRAADEVSRWRTADEDVDGPAALTLHFTELRIRLQARAYDEAFVLIESIGNHLAAWGLQDRLVPFRVEVRDQLDDNWSAINHNELGYAQLLRGDAQQARRSYRAAFDSIGRSTRPELSRRAYVGLGSVCLRSGDINEAVDWYGKALAIAEEFDDARDRSLALDGIARCRHFRGVYEEALRLATLALLSAQSVRSPTAVGIAARLSRWYAEVGQDIGELRMLGVAESEAFEHGTGALRAVYLDARADHLLAAGDPAAVTVAQSAVEFALRTHNPAILVQARSTLAFSCLRNGHRPEALREIERAARYRGEGRAPVVLALEGLANLGMRQRVRADEVFKVLRAETQRRVRDDDGDFAARALLGFAVCATDGQVGASLAAVRALLAQARATPTMDTPGVTARIRALLELLHRYRPGEELADIVANLDAVTARPGASC